MSWITVIWSMVASACVTLGAAYWMVWSRNRNAWTHLLFAGTAFSTAAFTFCELRQMRAGTPGELLAAMRWTHVSLLCLLVSTVWFVTLYLGAGRRWLAWTVSVLRALYLVVAFVIWGNVNYIEITSVQRLPFLGDSVTVFTGLRNPWMLFGYVTMLLILTFVADASVTAWRRGDRRQALMIGGSVAFFLVAGLGTVVAVRWGGIRLPLTFSLFASALVAVMGYELSRDLLRASTLVHELRASEAGLRESEARVNLEHLLRQEIAHAGRVSMIGQLASGLAHEINQPLAAILRNAEAAEMFLQHPSPDLDEIRAILADIRTDDERAGQIIDRMRGLLKRHTLDTQRLDVGSLVDDVAEEAASV